MTTQMFLDPLEESVGDFQLLIVSSIRIITLIGLLDLSQSPDPVISSLWYVLQA
jgi:hypothetical protein